VDPVFFPPLAMNNMQSAIGELGTSRRKRPRVRFLFERPGTCTGTVRLSGMRLNESTQTIVKAVAAGALAAGVLALGNYLVARRTERRHPPEGSFIVVDGVRLHYSDRGHGSPILLIHGNAVTGADWNTSGVADLLLAKHRVIIFDRPGFGYSERPRDRTWTAARQAELLCKALRQLGVERPIVVGHSWGQHRGPLTRRPPSNQ
jgi:hypothetical protein